MPTDTFQSHEYPSKVLKVDAVGKLAVPIITALAGGNRIAADAAYRDLPAYHREVLAMIGRYFIYEPPAEERKPRKKKS